MSVEFHGLDTETDNRPEGGHAVLVTVHGKDGARSLEFPRSWAALWNFLKGRTYAAFNADFDIRAICHDTFIPYRRLSDLGRFRSMRWRDWSFKYVPSKFLTVRRGRESFTVYDLKQFFGMSLDQTSIKHLTPDLAKQKIPRAWYPRMVKILKAGGWRADKVRCYAARDAESVYALTVKLVSSFQAIGVPVKKLISPASLTMEFFAGQLKRQPPASYESNLLWSQGFYGGRVEVGTLGQIGSASLYDIHSAYPDVIRRLPSLAGATLIETMGGREAGADVLYGLYKVRAYQPLAWHWGALAVRDGAKVIYPTGAVETWCCRPALESLVRLKVPFDVLESHEYVGRRREAIFSGIEDLYAARKNPVLGLGAKLMMNSLYGKLCETRRERIKLGTVHAREFSAFGRYTNYILAAHITETVRMKVFDVLHRFGKRAHVAATDSVLIEGELPTGPKLGDWDLKGDYAKATVFGCGRYVYETPAGDVDFFLRGFAPRPVFIDKIARCRRSYIRLPMLDTRSLLQWANDGASSDLNVLADVRRELRFDDDKRSWDGRFKRLADAFKFKLTSRPWVLGDRVGLEKLRAYERCGQG